MAWGDTESVSIDRADDSNVSVSSYGGLDSGVTSMGTWGSNDSGYDSQLSRQARESTRSPSANTGRSTDSSVDGSVDSSVDTNATRTGTRAAREDSMARRGSFSAKTALDAFNLSRDLDAEAKTQATQAQRSVDGYAPSSMDDRRDLTDRENTPRAYSPAAEFAGADAYSAAKKNGLLGTAATLFNPLAGVAVNAAQDARQANQYSRAEFDRDLGTGDKLGVAARSVGRNTLGGLLGRGMGQAGAKVGFGVGGIPGAVIGGIGGQLLGNKAVDTAFNQYGAPVGERFEFEGSESGGSPLLRQGIPAAPQVAGTGYSSSFGNYDSHLQKGFGFRSAFSAFG